MGRGTRPSHHQSPRVQPQTSVAADTPAVSGEACAADLPGAPAFTDGGINSLPEVSMTPSTVGDAKKVSVHA
jgi:hypothetical protein